MTAFHVLGELRVRVAGTEPPLGPPKQRAALAALLVDAGRLVPMEVLVGRVWDDEPPAEARNALYAHIMRIRRMLTAGSWRLTHRAGGYLLDIDPDEVDLHRFRRLLTEARDPDGPLETRAAHLAEALALWRGDPLADLSGAWVERLRESCRRQHVEAMVAWARTELDLGHHEAVATRASGWLGEHPLVEPLAALSMRALAAGGRAAESLEVFATTRRRLVDELGVEPGAELRDVHRAILRGDLDPVPPPALAPRNPPAGPAQLPMDGQGFTGRSAELLSLDELLKTAGDQPTAVLIAVLSGTAGVGKTTLAVHWAHQVADQFPDGQLHLNLHGFDPSEAPIDPSDAVCRLLDTLGVPRENVPAELDAQSGLLRSTLAGKRVLMLLDNARDAEQVRPLLPGSPGSLVLVTSRNRLPGLVVGEGAHPIVLDLLPMADARRLLTNRLGLDRVSAKPAAVDGLILACARLPLALAIVAAQAVMRPALSLADLYDQLGDASDGLDGFAAGDDDGTDLRAVLSWSYRALRPAAARLFRLLGLHTAPDIGRAAVAGLAGVPPARAGALLAELTRAHLLTEHVPGRYAFHDLLRVFARELAGQTEPEEDRHAAVHRLLDHYLQSARAATLLLYPQREMITSPEPRPGVTPEPVATEKDAQAWFAAERAGLLAAVTQAAKAGFDTHAWQLPWTLTAVLDRQGYWPDLAAVQLVALEAAGRTGHRIGQVHAHRGLARAYTRLGRLDDAYHHFHEALTLSSRLDDPVGVGNAHLNLGWVREHQKRYREASAYNRQALAVFRAAGHRPGQARALNAIGWNHALLGEHDEALARCGEALDLNRELGNRHSEANTWDSLGYVRHHLGDHQRAAECYRRAAELFRQVGDRYEEARTLVRTGDAYADAGAAEAAHEVWRAALAVLEELDHADAAQVRARLRP